MIAVDTRELMLHLNEYCTNALQNAAGLCVSRTHYEITVEHFLLKLAEDVHSDLPQIFQHFEVDLGRFQREIEADLEDNRAGNSGKPVFSPMLLELFQDAWMVASIDLGDAKIRSGAMLLAFLARPSFYGSGAPYIKYLNKVNRETLLKTFSTMIKNSVENKAALKKADISGAVGGGKPGAAKGTGASGGFVDRFCTDFTEKARGGGIDPVFGRDPEIRQMMDILARRRKNNPICVGEPGVGKTAVVEGLALEIVEGEVPDFLKNVRLLGLDMGLLEAGAGMKGEFENRLKGVINEIKESEVPIILFIDEAHTLIGAGGSAGTSDAANLLKPALARGELRTIAATTWKEYKKYFEKDPALERRFQLVKLAEPSVEIATLILRGIKASYEKAHNVIVRDDAIEVAAEYADRYITGRFLPDKAIDMLDTACARVKLNLAVKPPELEDKEHSIQALEREKAAMERDKTNGQTIDEEKYQSILDKIANLTAEAAEVRARWQIEKEAAWKVVKLRDQIHELNRMALAAKESGDEETAEAAEKVEEAKEEAPAEEGAEPAKSLEDLLKELDEANKALEEIQGDEPMIQIEVTPDVVGKVVSDWTGIPMGKVKRDEAATVVDLANRLQNRVKGQDVALDAMAEVIKAAKAGIKNPDQPIGVFLLVGPSGVGKTETGLALADLLFGSEKNSVVINMSEFQESHTVSRLIGSPPGYVGYGEGGMLSEAVRQKPYSVVLLDEVEKAHIDVMNLFYQVFDKGMLTDGEGKEINFKNTIMMLTSNLASDVIQEMTTGDEDERPDVDTVVAAIRPMLSQHFKPALLARMNIIPFFSLNKDAMKLIVELKLKKIVKTLMENNRMKLTYSEAVVDAVAARCTEVETGARNIEYILNGNVLPQLSQQILTHMTTGDMPSAVELGVGDDGSFTFEFKE